MGLVDKIGCGCNGRKQVFMAGDWRTDLAILGVIGISIAAIYVGVKYGKVTDG